jgi:hypothetical protein
MTVKLNQLESEWLEMLKVSVYPLVLQENKDLN